MTATIAPAADLSSVLARADKRFSNRSGDDPAPPEYIAALASAVAPLLKAAEDAGAELASATPAPAAVDESELERVRLELRRQTAQVETLRGQFADRGRELDQLRGELAEAKQAAEKVSSLEEDNTKLADDLADAGARVERLAAEMEQARAALQEKTGLIQQQRAQIEADSNHQHAYLWADPKRHPLPCACGKSWPLTTPGPERPAQPEPEPDPWDTIRTELKDWPRA